MDCTPISYIFFSFFLSVSEIAMVCGCDWLSSSRCSYTCTWRVPCTCVCVMPHLTNSICVNACKCVLCVRVDMYILMSYILYIRHIYIYIYGIYTYTACTCWRRCTHICNFHGGTLCACLFYVLFLFPCSLIYPLPYLASPCLAILILYSHVSLALFVSIYTSEREY